MTQNAEMVQTFQQLLFFNPGAIVSVGVNLGQEFAPVMP